MEPRTKTIIKTLIIIIILSLLIKIIFFSVETYIGSESYKNNPENWIEETNTSFDLDVNKIPGGSLEYDGYNQQFNDGNIRTAFFVEGWYDEKYFKNHIEDEAVKIKITNEFNPNDEYLDVFLSGVFVRGEPYIDIFLDKAWLDTLGKVNIWYGESYEHYAKFNFSIKNEIKPNLFHNRIKEDINRYDMNSNPIQSRGGLLIGNLDRNDWFNKDSKGKIIIRIK